MKDKFKESRLSGDTAQAETLAKEIADLKAQKELLEQHEDKDDSDIEEETEHFDETLGLKEEVAEKIRDAEKEKADILEEAREDNLAIPDGAFKEFDILLLQVKAAFDAGNYEEAKRLAQEARESLKGVEKQLESLQDIQDENEDLNDEEEIQQQEFEQKLEEADAEEAERIREEMNDSREALRKKREEIENRQNRIQNQIEGTDSSEQENDND
jgi:hypothetical protein